MFASWLLGILIASQPHEAPWIITHEDAVLTDQRLDFSLCEIDKAQTSRIYHYDVRAGREGYVIDTLSVRFWVFADGDGEIISAVANPYADEDSPQMLARGVVRLDDFAPTVELECVTNGKSQHYDLKMPEDRAAGTAQS